MRKIFVTGSSGFIGSALCASIEQAFQGPEGQKEALYRCDNSGLILSGDIRDALTLERRIADVAPDVIVHLAAIPGAEYCERYPQVAVDTNIMGTKNLLDAAVRHRVGLFVFISSSSVLGGTASPMDRLSETSPIMPKGVYGMTKAAGEMLVRSTAKTHGLRCAIIRPFSVYGGVWSEKLRTDTVIAKWIKAVQRDSSITLYGDGSSSRSYTCVEDVVRAIRSVIDLASVGSLPMVDSCFTVNVGGSEVITTMDIAQIFDFVLREKFPEKRRLFVKNVEHPLWDIEHSVADTSLAESVLGFKTEPRFRKDLITLLEDRLT